MTTDRNRPGGVDRATVAREAHEEVLGRADVRGPRHGLYVYIIACYSSYITT